MNTVPDLTLPLPPPEEPAVRSTPRPSRRWLVGGAALGVVGILAGVLAWRALTGSDQGAWRTSTVTRADLVQTVTATGTLSAVVTVDVGTQVSGRITELAVDFNDEVAEGQLLARIDPILLEADVDSARATLAMRVAERDQAEAELERMSFLAEREAASAQELLAAKSAATTARAQVQSARVALDRARRNLGYTDIVSPIDGIVVDRLVDVGQTVNAGTSAPTLYTLAGDLGQMQILATVDEADIGQVTPGLRTTFTVQAWPDATFEGQVRQVRLQSTTTDNVVTYTVVVDVDNPDHQLLPGMTANVDFVVAEARDVLTVPAAALRFRPAEAPRARGAAVWVPGKDGALTRVPVEVGLSDGSTSEVRGKGLTEGTVVATGTTTVTEAASSSSSPFQSEGSSRGGRRPGPPGAF